ncbi:MAG: hypothetical protein ABEI06_05420 [Halobacteriaceae archaeon]
MVSLRIKALVVFVFIMAFLQIFIEDVLIFIGTTNVVSPQILNSPLVMMIIPLTFATILFVVLVGGALLSSRSIE